MAAEMGDSLSVKHLAGTPVLSRQGDPGETMEVRIDNGRLGDSTVKFLKALGVKLPEGSYRISYKDASDKSPKSCRSSVSVSASNRPPDIRTYLYESGSSTYHSVAIVSSTDDLSVQLFSDTGGTAPSNTCSHILQIGNQRPLTIPALTPIVLVAPKGAETRISFSTENKPTDTVDLKLAQEKLAFKSIELLEERRKGSIPTTRSWAKRGEDLHAETLSVGKSELTLGFHGLGYFTSPSKPSSLLEWLEQVPIAGVIFGGVQLAVYGWALAKLTKGKPSNSSET